MVKLMFACLLVFLTIDVVSSAAKQCRAMDGKKVITFSRTKELIRFPCKYNAIRDTICGDWQVTVSPGNILEPNRNKQYVIKTIYVGAIRLSDGKYWQGRSDLKIARKYLTGIQDTPFNTKGGNLNIKDVFNFKNQYDRVVLIEKGGDFEVSFGLFNPEGRWHKSSMFNFNCKSKNFIPTAYPNQLCGNGTKQEVKTFRIDQGWKGNRQVALYYNIFSDPALIQTDENCILAQQAMTSNCVHNGEDKRYLASKLCWPILGVSRYQRCISGNMDSPIRAFRHCVEFVCSGYTNNAACESLGGELDFCPKLKEVSDEVKNRCMPNLYNSN